MTKLKSATDLAQAHLRAAFEALSGEGLSEKFLPLAGDVGQEKWTSFFGEFGSDVGMAMMIDKTPVPGEVSVSVITHRYRQTWIARLRESLSEVWAIFRGKETIQTIQLTNENVTKLKDLLRNL